MLKSTCGLWRTRNDGRIHDCVDEVGLSLRFLVGDAAYRRFDSQAQGKLTRVHA